MTCSEAIAFVDKVKPNHYDRESKFKWLSDLDGLIWNEILATHEENPVPDGIEEYLPERDGDTVLLVGAPYTDIYRWYLESQIDIGNQEVQKYNNSKAMYNVQYTAFADYYNRHHMPLQRYNFTFTARPRGVSDALST